MRTIGAIILSALAGVFAAESAHGRSGDPLTLGPFTIDTRLNLDLVAASGGVQDGVLGDLDIAVEFEAITADGLRWGLALDGRARRDASREIRGGRAGDCPPGDADCPASFDGVTWRTARGAAGGYVVSDITPPLRREAAIETAYLFLRSGRGELRLGAGPGAARLEAVPVPGAFRLMRADNGLVDPAGLAGVRTAPAISGFAPKLVYRSPRLLGLRASASFAPDGAYCGVDACASGSAAAGALSPRLERIWEGALSFERRLASGDRIALSTGYETAMETTRLPGFDNYAAWSFGARWSRGDWSAGAAALGSNNAVADGDYTALSASLARESGPWMVAAEIGLSRDAFAHVEGRSAQIGASRLIGDRLVLGAGVRHDVRESPVVAAGRRVSERESATSAFIEAGIRF